ncbi:unnamed protein product [Arctogadus glacialis]
MSRKNCQDVDFHKVIHVSVVPRWPAPPLPRFHFGNASPLFACPYSPQSGLLLSPPSVGPPGLRYVPPYVGDSLMTMVFTALLDLWFFGRSSSSPPAVPSSACARVHMALCQASVFSVNISRLFTVAFPSVPLRSVLSVSGCCLRVLAL